MNKYSTKQRLTKRKSLTILFIALSIFIKVNGSEKSPAGIGNSTGSNNQPKLVMWLDATTLSLDHGDRVSLVPDLSGNNNNAIQENPGNRPVFQLPQAGEDFTAPRIEFNSNLEHYLPFPGNTIAESDYTFSFVGGRLSDNSFRVFAGGEDRSNNMNLHVYFNGSNSIHHHHYGNDYNSSFINNGNNGGTQAGTMGIFSFLLDQNASSNPRRTYQNNDFRGAGNSNGHYEPLKSWNGASVGRYKKTSSNYTYHDVVFSEIIMYASALNDAQLAILNNFLHYKYEIGIRNLVFVPASPDFTDDIIGIGTTDGNNKHTSNNGMGGGIYLAERGNCFDNPGEKFVYASHNGSANIENTDNLPPLGAHGELTARSNRSWFVQRTGGTPIEINMGFNIEEIGLNPGESNQIFYLLYREDLSQPFSVVPSVISSLANGMVWFSLSDDKLATGYYSIARSNQTGRTWYSYKNGNWDDFRTWSLEQGGVDIINPAMLTPTTSPTAHIDRVVINSGHIVTVSANNKQHINLTMENGILDLGNTSGHVFGTITGTENGIIRLSGENFPDGNNAQFVSENGGTVELYGNDWDITQPVTFNNLIINLTNENSELNLLANCHLNGSLTVEQGIFTINDDTTPQILNITVNKHLIVNRRGKIITGRANTAGDFIIPGKMPAIGQYHSIFHQVKIGGNLTNEGTIRFTNQDAPHYKQFTNTGAVTLTFTGNLNQTAQLSGTTDLYNLIVDKGNDQTFELEINAMHQDYLRFFGPNNVGRNESSPFTEGNPEIRKALWIKNGTLKLTGSIYIPSLTEGNASSGNGDYLIPANGALWIASPRVTVFSTAHTSGNDLMPGTQGVENGSSNQALSVMGKYKITEGYLSTRNSAGLIIWAQANATVEIMGGINDVAQFRNAQNNDGKTTFFMTGGELIVRGSLDNFDHDGQIIKTCGGDVSDAYPIFGILDPAGVFSMSGGTITLYNTSGNNSYGSNAVCINSSVENHNVTGGTMRLFGYNQTLNYDLLTQGNLYSLEIKQINPSGNRYTRVYMDSDLNLEGNLLIGDKASLISRKEHGNYNGQTNDLTIARNFTIHSGGAYKAMENTTTLLVTGSQNSFFYLPQVTFHNLVIALHPTLSANMRSFNHTGQNTIVEVLNNLTLESGAVLRHHNQNIIVRGNIFNAGEIRHFNASSQGRTLVTSRGIVSSVTIDQSGSYTSVPSVSISAPQLPGGIQATAVPVFDGIPESGNALPLAGIVITNTGSGYTQTPTVSLSSGPGRASASISSIHNISGDGNGIFSDLEINEPHPSAVVEKTTLLSARQTVSRDMYLTEGIFDLQSYNLQINGKLSTQGQPNEETLYSETKMFRMNGAHSDGGLSLNIAANGTYIFPIGTYNPSAGSNRYAYARQIFGNVTNPGFVQINAVSAKLPTLSDDSQPNKRRYLRYYWRLRHTFAQEDIPHVYNQFRTYENDFYSGNGGVSFNLMIIGKVIDNVRYPQSGQSDDYLGTLVNAGSGSRILDFSRPETLLETGEFTSGRRQMFDGTITVFFNRTNKGSASNWEQSSTWSTVSHTSSVNTGGVPGIGDIVNLSNSGAANGNHYVTITQNMEVAKVTFSYVGSGWGPRLILRPGVRANINIVDGAGGQIGFQFTSSSMSRLLGDISGFVASPFANQIIFFPHTDTPNPIVLPDNFTEYPSVRIHAWGSNQTDQRVVSFPNDIVIKGHLRIDVNSTLRLHNGPSGDITVEGNLQVGPDVRGGRLEFPSTGTARKMIVNGNVFVGGTAYHQGQDSEIRVLSDRASGLLHQFEVKGNIVLSRNGKIRFFTNNTNGNNVALKLSGDVDASFKISEDIGNPFARFHSVELVKGKSDQTRFSFDSPFTLEGSTNGHRKALTLNSGSAIFNHNDIDVVLSSGGADFAIPANTGLIINRGTARINTPGSNGIFLDGLLEVNGPDSSHRGQLLLDGGEGSDNYICYSSSGRAVINITGGHLLVGSQIRGSLDNDSGILKYSQLGKSGYASSMVIIGKNSAPATNRGVFEIHNPSSRFRTYNGTITLVRGHASPAMRAALYLNPSSTGLNEWGALVLGDGNTESTITVNSSIELPSVTVKALATAQTHTNHFVTMGNLLVENDAAFDGNGLNLTVKKNFRNEGAPEINCDTLFMMANTEQWMDGGFVVNHLFANPAERTWLQANTNLLISEDFTLAGGFFDDGGNTIALMGNLTNNGRHLSGVNGKIYFNGIANQYISGNGLYGNLEIDNPAQIKINNDLLIENKLTLTHGVLNIGAHRLTFSANATLEGVDHSATKMIATSGSIADKGIRHELNPGATNLNFPMGVISGTVNKYTPAHISISGNDGAGFININPVNQTHMTATGTDVLDFYWIVQSEGLNNVNAEMQLRFSDDDINGDLQDYYTARLVGDGWQKLPVGVNAAGKYAEFYFGAVSDMNGDYTAGIDPHIPAQIPVFISDGDGSWSDMENWSSPQGSAVPSGGPNGHIVIIREGDEVTLDRFRVLAYRTEIYGTLNTGVEAGHNMGRISGTGTLRVQDGKIPAGIYNAFFEEGTNSTVVYDGAETYIIPDLTSYGISSNTYNNLEIAGAGQKILPNKDIWIRNDLTLSENATLQSRALQTLFIAGNLTKLPGSALLTDYTGQWIVFNGNHTQNLSGDFTSMDNQLRNVDVSNSYGIDLQSNITIKEKLSLSNGNIYANNQTVTLSRANDDAIVAQPGNYVNGTLKRNLDWDMNNAVFPVGKNNIQRNSSLYQFNPGYWQIEYMPQNPSDFGMSTDAIEDLELLGDKEYWKIEGPAAGTATMQLSWGLESSMPNVEPHILENYIAVAQWVEDKWVNKGNASAVALGNGTGYVKAAISSTPSVNKSGAMYFALGSSDKEMLPLPIELISFTGKPEDNAVLLQWITASEINNNYFTLERSVDGVIFETIAIIASKAEFGNSSSLLQYSFPDMNPVNGLAYYRLKQTDFDGTSTHSDLIAIQPEITENVDFRMFPNPNTDNAFRVALQGLQAYETFNISIVDFYGKTVYSNHAQTDATGNLFSYVVPQGRMQAGVYIVNVSGDSGNHSQRLVVQ